MQLLVCFSALVAVALARPQYNPYYNNPNKPVVPILAYSNEVNHDGSYQYSYQTGDGSAAQESGYLKNAGAGPEREAQTVQGSYSYTAPDGTPINVRYVADENGFRAEGAHLPTPPPIPEAIARSLEFNAIAQRNNPVVYQPNQQYYKQPYRQY